MRVFNFFIAIFCFSFISCTEDNTKNIDNPSNDANGSKMVLIGNSFFKPYANHLNSMALHAGFEDHEATVVFRGGENGRPINFWEDSNSAEHLQIKTALDEGNVEYFGMTSGHEPNDRIEGHRAWISYALQKNPNIKIFIAIPPVDFPANWDQFAQDNGFNSIQELYDYFVNQIVHQEIIDQLRAEFPNTTIFTIPTGWAAINIAQMKDNNDLLDDVSWFGSKPESIFTDQKGHQGQIVIETGTLIWLQSIYNVDLTANTYDTGFNTDLHQIATNIVVNHDNQYKQN